MGGDRKVVGTRCGEVVVVEVVGNLPLWLARCGREGDGGKELVPPQRPKFVRNTET